MCLSVDSGKADTGRTVDFDIKYSSLLSPFVCWLWCRFSQPSSQAHERLPFFDSSELVEPNMPSVIHALMVATQALSVSLESGGCTASKY